MKQTFEKRKWKWKSSTISGPRDETSLKSPQKSREVKNATLSCSVPKTNLQSGSLKVKHQNDSKIPARLKYAYDTYSINVYLRMESLALGCMSRYFFLAISA